MTEVAPFSKCHSVKVAGDLYCVSCGAVLVCKGMLAKEGRTVELNDIYDSNRNRTGRLHRRGTPWNPGEYGLVVCVWVYDGKGNYLLTRRAKEKSFAGTWENSGGAAQAGEESLQAIRRELFEETGIRAEAEEFELIDQEQKENTFYDHYCLSRDISVDRIVLLPGETDDVKWADSREIHRMIEEKQICHAISQQFIKLEPVLRAKQKME